MNSEEESRKFREAFEKHTYDDLAHFADMKSSLLSLESESAELKRISMEIHDQTKKTNGRVNWHDRVVYTGMGTLALLVPVMGWITVDYLNHRDKVPADAIQAAVNEAFKENTRSITP